MSIQNIATIPDKKFTLRRSDGCRAGAALAAVAAVDDDDNEFDDVVDGVRFIDDDDAALAAESLPE